jgi:hypothetical protein
MTVQPADAWKLALAIALGGAIVMSLRARAPRRAVPSAELRRLVYAALALYLVGALAWITGHAVLAGIVYAVGIATAALAAWLSRGRDSEDPPGDDYDEPVDEDPPFGPDGVPYFNWESFERDFRSYSERRREPAGLD